MTAAPSPSIVAVGAGRMGRGIAQVFAYAGHPVTILDFKDRSAEDSAALIDAAKTEIRENLDFLISLDVMDAEAADTTLSRINGAPLSEAENVLASAEFIFEGVPEVLVAKQDALQRIGELAGEEAIVASTTSTMLVDELSKFIVHPERFLNAHWLNPAYLIPLVEVSPSDGTDEAVVQKLMKFLESVGKVPVRCKASPGYIVPRIQSVAMNEAARMVEEGVATAEDIDRAVRAGFGIRYATMGLIEFIDWGGVEILQYASRYLKKELGSERFDVPKMVDDMIARGDRGLSAGKGFYDFSEVDPDEFRREKLATFVSLLKFLDLMPPPADK